LPDLRDVLFEGDRLLVTRFRSAELIEVRPDGTVAARRTPPRYRDDGQARPSPGTGEVGLPSFGAPGPARTLAPAVAWRTRALAPGAAVMAHQLDADGPVSILPAGYASPGGAGAIVRSAVTIFQPGGTARLVVVEDAPLPVDVAAVGDGSRLVLVASGNHGRGAAGVTAYELIAPPGAPFLRIAPRPLLPPGDPHQVVAVDVAPSGEVVLQSREPAAVAVGESWIEIEAPSMEDTGHAMFHLATPGGVACASCHPEGADDGRIWTFTDIGRRRTQPLDVGVIGTEPFHWKGELADLPALVNEVYVRRMSGRAPAEEHVLALAAWLDGLVPIAAAAPADPLAVARGAGHFRDGRAGCATCHAGPRFSAPVAADVGTGGRFQVPSLLGVGSRVRLMHDGCAGTLEERFGRCGGARHGSVAHLGPDGVADLVAYLRTL
jgi:hypothetical protein